MRTEQDSPSFQDPSSGKHTCPGEATRDWLPLEGICWVGIEAVNSHTLTCQSWTAQVKLLHLMGEAGPQKALISGL